MQGVIRSKQRRSVFHLIAGAFAMTDILRRSWAMISDGAKPIDWLILIVDVLVLMAILGFEGVGEFRYRKERKRRSNVERIVGSLCGFMDKGQKIQREVPKPKPSFDPTYDAITRKIEEWENTVSIWSGEVHGFLQECSAREATSFILIAGTNQPANPQIVCMESGRSFPIEGSQRESYQKLAAQLSNLRSIIEKPEAYF